MCILEDDVIPEVQVYPAGPFARRILLEVLQTPGFLHVPSVLSHWPKTWKVVEHIAWLNRNAIDVVFSAAAVVV